MRRPSLFRLLYWRAMALMVACVAIFFGVSYYVHTNLIYRDWQHDLQQEAEWIAGRWTAETSPAEMADAWRSGHDSVRLSIRDDTGAVIGDSRPDRPPVPADWNDLSLLVGKAGIPGGMVILSRWGQPSFPLHPEILLLLALLGGMAALFFLPLVRSLKHGLERLSAQAARVAAGQFGETIEPPRQRELADLTASFNDMSLHLRDAELRQRRLVADVSHELRSPMGRLRALAETIGRNPAETGGYLSQMDDEIALMDRLVGDMLEMARFAENSVDLQRRPVSLRHWLTDLVERARHRVESAGVVLSAAFHGADAESGIDPQRLTQAVGNLLDNAVAAVRGRDSARIDLALETTSQGWSLSLRDNGRGIPEADIPYIFDRFYRVEKHRGHQGGAGLGLSIAKAIVEAHGGIMAIDSLPDHGTAIRLTFPLEG